MSGWVRTSGRGRCRECGSQALRRTDETELSPEPDEIVPCPFCGGSLDVQHAAIWD